MSKASRERIEWVGAVERAVVPLVETASGDRYGLPPLPNADYRALAAAAKNDANARTAFDLFVIKLNRDVTEMVELLSRHPAIEPNATGASEELATFVEMPSKGFRLELRDLARHLTRSAIMRGCRAAVTHLERFLTLSAEGSVPGYEITVFRGLSMEDEVEVAAGIEIVSYKRAAERGLVRNEPPGPANDMPDYAGMNALVLAREMTWGPCLVPPKTSRNMGSNVVPTFTWFDRHQSGVLFDLLTIVTSHRIQVLSVLTCAPEFVDVNPNFGPGSSTGFLHSDHWSKKDLTRNEIEDLRSRLHGWSRFDADKRATLELAVSRLAAATQRGRGRLGIQDRILDVAIALEVMYQLVRSGRYTLTTRASHFLADQTDERLRVANRAGALYKTRNDIVHGNVEQTKEKHAKMAATAEDGTDLARETLWKLLDQGAFPEWERLIMS